MYMYKRDCSNNIEPGILTNDIHSQVLTQNPYRYDWIPFSHRDPKFREFFALPKPEISTFRQRIIRRVTLIYRQNVHHRRPPGNISQMNAFYFFSARTFALLCTGNYDFAVSLRFSDRNKNF